MSLSENIAKIRNSVYGKDVREAIAASIEGMDANSKEYARQAAASATTSSSAKDTAVAKATQLSDALDDIADIKNSYQSLNAHNIFRDNSGVSGTNNGIAFTWNGNICHVEGTSTAYARSNFYVNESTLPTGLSAGSNALMLAVSTDSNVTVQIYAYKNGQWVLSKTISGISEYTVPSDCKGLLMRLNVDPSKTVNGDITVGFINTKTNAMLTDELSSIKTKVETDIATEMIMAKDTTKYVSNNTITLSDIKENGIYIISDAYTVTDKPSDLKVTLLTVEHTSYANKNAFIRQTVSSVSPTNNKVYYRISNSSGNTYSEWVEDINGYSAKQYLKNNGVLASCDMNDALGNYYAIVLDTNTYTNIPNSLKAGLLQVQQYGSWYMQIFYTTDTKKTYRRRRNSNGVWTDWADCSSGDVVNNYYTNEHTHNHYSNTYNVTATPIITTDNHSYLASSNDTTDRTTDIVTMLTQTGVCHLGSGKFYVSGVDMPKRSMLYGEGASTEIVLLGNDYDDGYAIKLNSYCCVKDMTISGSTTSIAVSADVLNRHGILWEGDATENGTSNANIPIKATVENVIIRWFKGGGITCDDTGYGTANCINATNVYIEYCRAGINISYWSEFHRFTNVHVISCYYGCINNGGNNSFVNCGFSGNRMGMLMDNSEDQSPNNSHGSIIGCVFNHTDSNSGIGLKILNCNNGQIISGCQFFFSQIYIKDCSGIEIANSNFGNTNCDITVDGGGVTLFTGNIHQARPNITVTNNDKVHFVNCYSRNTGEAVTN